MGSTLEAGSWLAHREARFDRLAGGAEPLPAHALLEDVAVFVEMVDGKRVAFLGPEEEELAAWQEDDCRMLAEQDLAAGRYRRQLLVGDEGDLRRGGLAVGGVEAPEDALDVALPDDQAIVRGAEGGQGCELLALAALVDAELVADQRRLRRRRNGGHQGRDTGEDRDERPPMVRELHGLLLLRSGVLLV